jgi:hypothetical protein
VLVILRIFFGALLLYALKSAWQNGQNNLEGGDISNAGYVAVCVILAIANALVWAPYFGAKVSDPLTGVLTTGIFVEKKNYLLRLIYWLQDHGYYRLLPLFCFLEGIHYPDRPTGFALGLKHAKSGSWLEKVFAKEVFKFDNAQNCVVAYQVLKRHNIEPGSHRNPEINIVLLSLNRAAKPDPERLIVPQGRPFSALKRNDRISLFAGAKKPTASNSTDNSTASENGGAVSEGVPGSESPDAANPTAPDLSDANAKSGPSNGGIHLLRRIRTFLEGS